MHPEPQHLKNFARNSQWIRGKKVRNNAFFSRFQWPGLERLLACHTFVHLIRAIGHHIVRLACRSVSIMGWPSVGGARFTRECGESARSLTRANRSRSW